MTDTTAPKAAASARAMILPLALAQFIASYAATNMNVAISVVADHRRLPDHRGPAHRD